MGMESKAADPPGDVWARDLAQRVALATPADTAWGAFLRSTLEAIRVLGDEGLVRRCREVCGHEQPVEFFRYPVRLRLQMMALCLEPLAARHGGSERALRLLGRQGTSAFLCSHAGRLMLMLAGGDRKRLLEGAHVGFRMGLSYGKHTTRWAGPACFHWSMEREFMPLPFMEGVLEVLVESSGARNVRVVGRQTGALDGEYELTWE
ncbi:MAG TPA: TIGR02265 family protein [Archangium sp.]|uniref:TIGR02265 family protein n=1 Tax=Archangium sp. TaxID=1872627 RepID=UPI002E36C1DA|nr:TIGR02265 family protein [Archangium sp.]HEX5745563.1 TIGR02265 family protein [Archangium sp.]